MRTPRGFPDRIEPRIARRRSALRIVAAATAVSLLVVACGDGRGGDDGADGDGAAAGDDLGEVELTYKTHTIPAADELNASIIESFEGEHEGITVQHDTAPFENIEEVILTEFAAGDSADVFWIGDWMVPQLIAENALAPVDYEAFGVSNLDEFQAMYQFDALAPYIHDGDAYTGGPSEFNTISLLYNLDHFEEAGLDPLPTDEPITWEEFAEIAETLADVDADGTMNRSGFHYAYAAPEWHVFVLEPMLHQLGSELVDAETGEPNFDSPEMQRVMEWVADMSVERRAMDIGFFNDFFEDFAAGRNSTMLAGAWALPIVRDINADVNIGVAPTPVFADGERSTLLYSWAWHVSSQADENTQRAAWELVDELTQHQQSWWDEVGYIQAREGETEGGTPIFDYYVEQEPAMEVFLDDFEYGQHMFRSTKFYEIADILKRSVERVTEGEDVATVLADAQESAEFALE